MTRYAQGQFNASCEERVDRAERVPGDGGVRFEAMVLITGSDAHVLSRTAFCDRLLH